MLCRRKEDSCYEKCRDCIAMGNNVKHIIFESQILMNEKCKLGVRLPQTQENEWDEQIEHALN